MCETVDVVTLVDHDNKIIYVEEQTFALGSEAAKNARKNYLLIAAGATQLGYKIEKQEKTVGSGPKM